MLTKANLWKYLSVEFEGVHAEVKLDIELLLPFLEEEISVAEKAQKLAFLFNLSSEDEDI